MAGQSAKCFFAQDDPAIHAFESGDALKPGSPGQLRA